MWIPRNESELLQAITDSLIETATFDAKARLPLAAKNVDVAIDVAAMANDGGVLLSGLAEDEHKRLVPAPIPLAGAAERVATCLDILPVGDPNFEEGGERGGIARTEQGNRSALLQGSHG
jgi:hypothetical protein